MNKQMLKNAAYLIPHDARNMIRKKIFKNKHTKVKNKLQCDQVYSYAPYVKKNAIFVHIPKTGGVSIAKSIFGSLAGGHSTVGNYQCAFSKREFESMFKFSFVRNPWSRLYSAYNYLISGGMRGRDPSWTGEDLKKYASFSDFVVHGLAKHNVYAYTHFAPQTDFVSVPFSRKIRVNFIGLFENMHEDFEYICNVLDIEDMTLLHLNRGSKSLQSDYRNEYTNDARRIVENIYARDIKTFGYDFEGVNVGHQIRMRVRSAYGRKRIIV